MTIQDLAQYEAFWSEPIRGRYGVYNIYAPGPPATGGVDILEALQILDSANLRRFADRPYESGEALFWLANILDIASLTNMPPDERFKLYAASDLSFETRSRPESARWIWKQIESSNGDFFKRNGNEPVTDNVPSHSAAVVAVDQWGNMVSLVHTINTVGFGYSGLFVDGVSIPDSAWFQRSRIKRTGAGNRVPARTNPVIVALNGKPVLGSSAIGYSLHHQTVQGLYYALEYGLSPNDAAGQPTLLQDWATSGGVSAIRTDFDTSILEDFVARGGKLKEVSNRGRYWIAVAIDPESGRLSGSDAVHNGDPDSALGLAQGY